MDDGKDLQLAFLIRVVVIITEQMDTIGARGGSVDEYAEYVGTLKVMLLKLCALMHLEYHENDDGAFLNLARNSLAIAEKLSATEQ